MTKRENKKGISDVQYFRNNLAAMEDREVPYEATTEARKKLRRLEEVANKGKNNNR